MSGGEDSKPSGRGARLGRRKGRQLERRKGRQRCRKETWLYLVYASSQPLGIGSDCVASVPLRPRGRVTRQISSVNESLNINGEVRSRNTFWPEHAAIPTPEEFFQLDQRGFFGQGRNVGQTIERTLWRRKRRSDLCRRASVCLLNHTRSR